MERVKRGLIVSLKVAGLLYVGSRLDEVGLAPRDWRQWRPRLKRSHS